MHNIKKSLQEALQRIDNFRLSSEERLEAAAFLRKNFTPDLHSVCEIDLHCHTFFSDGYCSPAMRVFEAYRRRMRGIAIADHDVFDGQSEAIAAGELFGITVVPAIEFYSSRPGIEIIGHFPDVTRFMRLLRSGSPNSVIEPVRKAKKRQLEQMVARIPEAFARLQFPAEINADDIDRFLRNGMSTKGDISVVMWQKYGRQLHERGLAADVKEFHTLYTTRDAVLNCPLELDIDLTPEAFVRRILEWGGLPGLPHPGELRKKEGKDNRALRETIEELGAIGLQTIEVDGWRNGICPETGLPQTELFEQLRNAYNAAHPERLPLLFTNGSDDHNQPGEGLELGCGRNDNLHPEFGRYANLECLSKRQERLLNAQN